MKNKKVIDIIIPIVIGIVSILLEIVLGSQMDTILFIPAIIITTTILLLLIYKRHDVCGWFTVSNCGGLLAIFLYITLSNPYARFDYSTIYFLLMNWIGVTLTCFTIKLVDKNDKFDNFKVFFKLSSIIFIFVYVFVLSYAVFFKSSRFYGGPRGINLIPFKTIIPYLTGTVVANTDIMVVNLLANIFLLIPFGFYLNIISKRYNMFTKIAALFTLPVVIEIIQYITRRGISDIDDVILNFIGGLLGMLLLNLIEKVYSSIRKSDSEKMFVF